MFARRFPFVVSVFLIAALALPACGPISGGTIKIYVSLPLETSQGKSILKGIELAASERKNRLGDFQIEIVSRTDSLASGQWDASREEANAREAVADPDVMVYLGPYNSGAAQVSIPITNRGGLTQISPGNTAPELTKAGFRPGQPGEFYPTGRRSYFRTCPTDDLQGPAGAVWALESGYQSVFILDDGEVYGAGIANLFEEKAFDIGLAVLGHETIDKKASDFQQVLARVAQADPDLVYFGGVTPNGAPLIVKQMRQAGIRAAFMVPDGAVDSDFIQGAGSAAEGVLGTLVGEPPRALTTSEGRAFYDAYKSAYEEEPEPFAQFGYDAARVAFAAIEQTGAKDRRAILEAIAATRDFPGTGGLFGFDRNGDTTLKVISGNRVEKGVFEFDRKLNPGS